MTPRTEVLVAHQPAYLPWPGFFARLLDVDRLLLLDGVQYTQGGWQNRNFVAGPHGVRVRMTVPVCRGFGQPISHVRIAEEPWRARHWRTLTHTYRRAPYWDQWEERLRTVYARPWTHLAAVNEELIRLLLEALGLPVTLLRSTQLAPAGAKTRMLIDLCQRTGTRVLRVGTGATTYLDVGLLAREGIAVEVATWTSPPRVSWPGGPLSVLDLVLRHGPAAREILAEGAQVAPWRGGARAVSA